VDIRPKGFKPQRCSRYAILGKHASVEGTQWWLTFCISNEHRPARMGTFRILFSPKSRSTPTTSVMDTHFHECRRSTYAIVVRHPSLHTQAQREDSVMVCFNKPSNRARYTTVGTLDVGRRSSHQPPMPIRLAWTIFGKKSSAAPRP
jgi:hypothetical protein